MRNQLQHKIKKRTINLNQTAQLINHKQYQSKDVLLRYRKTSLPTSIGYHSINIRNSYEQQSTDIYFNPVKKSKFIKQIVDNYFEDTLQKIYGNEKQSNSREIKTLQRNIKNISKRQKDRFFINGQIVNNKKEGLKAPKVQSGNKQTNQEQQSEVYQSINSSANITSSFLPPIVQSHEDLEDLGQIFPEMSQTSPQINIKGQHIQKTLTFQNEAFRIFLVSQNGQPVYRVKQFKQSGMQILKREQRILKFGVGGIWKESHINANSFVSQLIHPLKNLICKLIPNHEGNIKFKVRSTEYRRYLLANNCQQLKHLIREICTILKKLQGRVLNNKINPSNIFILKGNRVCIGQWGYSSFRDQYQIQQNKFESRINPILKSSKQWLATPQYLSPELLQAVLAKSQEEQPDIWQNKSSSDIWSLGITIFQILTMTPIWMNQMCSLKSRGKKPSIRCGLLGTSDRKLEKISQKQKKIQKSIKQCLQNETEEQMNRQIIDIVNRMIVYEPSERITLDQILLAIK